MQAFLEKHRDDPEDAELPSFNASHGFIYDFKKNHGITQVYSIAALKRISIFCPLFVGYFKEHAAIEPWYNSRFQLDISKNMQLWEKAISIKIINFVTLILIKFFYILNKDLKAIKL